MKVVLFKINWLNPKQALIGLFTQSSYCHAGLLFPPEIRLYDASESRGDVDYNKWLPDFKNQEITVYDIPEQDIAPMEYALKMRGTKYDWKGIAGWAPLPLVKNANDREKVYCFELVLQTLSRYPTINGYNNQQIGSSVYDKLYHKRIDSDDILYVLQKAGLVPVYKGKAKDYLFRNLVK